MGWWFHREQDRSVERLRRLLWLGLLGWLGVGLTGCRAWALPTLPPQLTLPPASSQPTLPLKVTEPTATPVPITPASRPFPLLVGVYPRAYVAKVYIQQELDGLEAWAGRRLSLVGFFSDLEDPNPAYNLPAQLEAVWARGSVPLVNLNIGTMGSPRTARALARGALDGAGQRWFAALAAWLRRGEGRFVLLAPLPEANIRIGNTYGGDPQAFRAAFRHLQGLAQGQGVPLDRVHWVFAPNGWTAPGDPPLAAYFPEMAQVDAVGFSAFNWGYCARAASRRWDAPAEAYGPYLQILRSIAPGKPILITQTATTSQTAHGADPAAKDAWLREAFAYLGAQPDVLALMYFNLDKECDWAVYLQGVRQAEGFAEALQDPAVGYWGPAAWAAGGLDP